jgi:hypothetical protein
MSKPRKHPRFLPAKMETEREKYDDYEWCKSELPGCERQASMTAILNNVTQSPKSRPSIS